MKTEVGPDEALRVGPNYALISKNGSTTDRERHPEQPNLDANLRAAKQRLKDLIGIDPRFVRGPFGLIDTTVAAIYKQEGIRLDYVFWDIDGKDSTGGVGDSEIKNTLKRQVMRLADRARKDGKNRQLIAQFHDTSVFTAAFLADFLQTMIDAAKPRNAKQRPVVVRFCESREAVEKILGGQSHKPRARPPGRFQRTYRPKEAIEETTLQAWNLIRWEYWVPYLYLDSRGLVTTGVGHRVISGAASQKLPLKKGSDEATAKEKADEWKTIADIAKKPGFKPAKHIYRFYANKGKLRLEDPAIRDLMLSDVRSHVADLKTWLGDGSSPGTSLYDECPLPARLALLDMVFNLGIKGLRKYETLLKAVKERDWPRAAAECHRIGPPPERNDFTKELFFVAGKLDGST